jgi:uncharacterized protein YbaP (TraB family)
VCWALDNPSVFRQVFELSYAAWIAGDFQEIERISSLQWLHRFPTVRHAVISARNALWLPTIRKIVQSATDPVLVLVGAAHLGGSDGLVPQLTAEGVIVTPLI